MNNVKLQGSRVLVTGGNGFLGRYVVRELEGRGALVFAPFHSPDRDTGFDLTKPGRVDRLFDMIGCSGGVDCVVHLAGWNGGVEWNRRHPGKIFIDNTLMGLNVLNTAARRGVKKILSAVASCAYPFLAWHGGCEADLMMEEHFLGTEPHPSVACHGFAKRNLQLASLFLHEEFGTRAVTVCPTTLYGPGDSYDPERTKIVGAMIKRFCDAVDSGATEVTCWGDGTPLREVLYVEDAARLLVDSLVKYEDSFMPLNLGSGQEWTVAEIARLTAKAAGYTGKISWDSAKPNGQRRKRLSCDRMREVLGEQRLTPLEDGLKITVADYTGRSKA